MQAKKDRTHTHVGHCQACGRIHAVRVTVGTIAKHGYTVDRGYFSGTCSASDELPLEIDRTVCDRFAAACDRAAISHDASAAEYAAGVRLPMRCSYGNKWTTNEKGRGEFVEQWKSWDESDESHRAGQVKWEIEDHTRHADFMRSHARRLRELAARVHGQPLKLAEKIVHEKPARPTVDVAAAKVTGAYTTKAARKDDLDRLNRQYDKARRTLQDLYLNGPHRENKQATELYFGAYSLAHWRPKHSELALQLYGEAARETVQTIETLCKAREAVKAAP